MIPEILLQEIQKRRCLLFVGAGLSLNAELPNGVTMPTWSQLAEQLSADLVEKKDDALEIASLYEKTFGRNNLIKKMTELLHVQDAKPGRVHKKLAKINEFDTIVTTNFEHLLEQPHYAENKNVNVIVGDKNIIMYSPSTHTNIIKIHGDFSNYPEIVITKEDYDAFHKEHPVLATNVAAWFSTKTPLFIGYSLNDPHFIQIRNLLKETLGKFLNFWFVVKFDATPEETEEARKDGIYMINLPTDSKTREESLLEFLCQIQDYVTAKQVDALSITSKEESKETKKEISKDNLTGKIVNAFSDLEVSLRITLEKFGHTQKDLKRPFTFLIKSALSAGVLTTADVGELSHIRDLRNNVTHTQYQPTQKDAEYVEKFANQIILKLSKIETVTVSPIQIELFTNKDSYQNDETLLVRGKVSKILSNFPISIIITGPDNNVVYVSQLQIDTKREFESTYKIGGPLWQKSGDYKIIATYGLESNRVTKTINYKKTERLELTNQTQLIVDGKSHTISYLVQGGSLEGLFVTLGTNILTVQVNAFTDGKLLMKIPRLFLDAKKENNDDDFFVLVDGEEVEFDEIATSIDRTLTVQFVKGTKEIMIVGTSMIGGTTLLKDEDVVEILEGSSVPRDDEKYLKPQTLIIKQGQTVTWKNCDSAAHTITSGTPEKGADGNFDSSLFMAGNTYSVTFKEKGTYRYFCLVHPWKEGKIIVTE